MGARATNSWYLQDNYCKKCNDRSYKRCVLECEHYEHMCIAYEGKEMLDKRRKYWGNVTYNGADIYVKRNKIEKDFYTR